MDDPYTVARGCADGCGAAGVHADECALGGGLCDGGGDHGVIHGGGDGLVARGHPIGWAEIVLAARREELDEPHPQLTLLAHHPAHLFRVADLDPSRPDAAPRREVQTGRPQPGPGDDLAVDGALDEHVDSGLEGARPDERRVARSEVGLDHACDLEGVLVLCHPHDAVAVEVVEGRADVGVGVAQPGESYGSGDVDHLHGAGVDRCRPSKYPANAITLDQDVALERALREVTRARDDSGVGDEGATLWSHVVSSSPSCPVHLVRSILTVSGQRA